MIPSVLATLAGVISLAFTVCNEVRHSSTDVQTLYPSSSIKSARELSDLKQTGQINLQHFAVKIIK